MGAFFLRHQYLIVWILGLVIIGSLATLIVQLNEYIPSVQPSLQGSMGPVINSLSTATAPSLTFSIEMQGANKNLLIRWHDLPSDTTALGIFRNRTGATTTGQLIAVIHVSQSQLGSGASLLNLGPFDEAGYSFYVQALNDTGNEDNTSSTATSTVIWTSDPIVPTFGTPTSTNQGSGGGGGGNQNQTPSSTATTTPQNNTPPADDGGTPGGGAGPGNGTSSPVGGGGSGPNTAQSAYYTPQIQGIGGTTDHGTFWVQHSGQSIQINWQGLPNNVTSIIIARSENQDGPWNQILKEENPSVNGSSSLQLVDGTLGDPYYYEMTAFSNNITIGTFGPEYLPGA